MNFNVLLFIIAGLIGFSSANAETNNKLIVKLEEGQDASYLTEMGFQNIEVLIADLGIYSVDAHPAAVRRSGGLRALTQELRRVPGVIYAQEDHKITMRVAPNDKNFNQQWDFLKNDSSFGIDALNAWTAYGTGGKDYRNNDIVVAVVDAGVDMKHEDLAKNIWVNTKEIPNNKIDDDKNGFVDDVNGWDGYSNTGKVPSDRHGTHVAGTIGAIGNNGLHGTGVNWNVKIMPIGGSSSQTSVVLKAYGYVLAQKKLWLESGGLIGANVVATNSSFGVDYANCHSSTYAAWNDIYDQMGKYGILHAAATINGNTDVDKKGDVPTGCASEYIVSVTNTQKNGVRNGGAGYGLTTIDIAAPGTDIYSTVPNNGWSTMTGTSMATPHVAGAIAYLHSVASKNFNDLYYKDPAGAALILKQTLIKTVTPMAALKNNTVSGGILNLNSAAASISKF